MIATNLTFTACTIPELQQMMETDLCHIKQWLQCNKLSLNIMKTEYMIIGSRHGLSSLENCDLNLSVDDTCLRIVEVTTCLGLEIDENITWHSQVNKVKKNVYYGVLIPFVKLSPHLIKIIYFRYINQQLSHILITVRSFGMALDKV